MAAGSVEAHVFLLPLVRPVLEVDLLGISLSKRNLLLASRTPISREGFQRLISAHSSDSNSSYHFGKFPDSSLPSPPGTRGVFQSTNFNKESGDDEAVKKVRIAHLTESRIHILV